MQILKQAIYAVRLCKALSNHTGVMKRHIMAEMLSLSPNAVQQVMLPLLRDGIVVSTRGRYGGYVLRRKRPSIGAVMAAYGGGICPPVEDDGSEEAKIRRDIATRVERLLRQMKVTDL